MFDALFSYPDEATAILALGPLGYRDRWGRDAWDGARVTPVSIVIAAAVYAPGPTDPETGAPTSVLVTPVALSPGCWLGIATAEVTEVAAWKLSPACMVIMDRDASASSGDLVCAWINPALAEPDRDPPRTAAERIAAVVEVRPVWAGARYPWGAEVVEAV